ncbi:hypothetical protein ACK0NM_22070 [Pseudomonas aeruginosa]|uniref:hypothetical protein n=1 Tax=Pseudomonas aeruginosa TaxID=287 RepID=UPI0021FD98A1|nr:hypothetical protein PAER4900a_00054 [Pseudomonas phage YMC17/07/R4900a]
MIIASFMDLTLDVHIRVECRRVTVTLVEYKLVYVKITTGELVLCQPFFERPAVESHFREIVEDLILKQRGTVQ